MLLNNHDNLTPNPDGDSNGGPFAQTPTRVVFVDLQQFSAWLDLELHQLEKNFHEFETFCSRRVNFRHSR